MIVHVLQQGFTATTQGDFEWNTEINGTTMEYAKAIMNYLIAQKFELMPPEIRLTNCSESATGLDKAQLNHFPLVRQYASKVAKVLLHKDTPKVSSTVIAQEKFNPCYLSPILPRRNSISSPRNLRKNFWKPLHHMALGQSRRKEPRNGQRQLLTFNETTSKIWETFRKNYSAFFLSLKSNTS